MNRAEIPGRYGPWAVVAGASEGLGEAFAHAAAAHGLHVALIARRAEALEEVGRRIRETHSVETRQITLDLGDPDAASRIVEATADLDIGMLIYNAAAEPQGRFLDVPLAEHLQAIDVNCRTPLALCHRLGPAMVERGRGSLVLVTSLGGLCGLRIFSSYGASKAFDWSLGEALWDELRDQGVDALAYVVGSTRTPNLERSGAPEAHLREAAAPKQVADRLFTLLDQGPTQYGQPEVEEAARHMLRQTRRDVVTQLGEANSAVFEG